VKVQGRKVSTTRHTRKSQKYQTAANICFYLALVHLISACHLLGTGGLDIDLDLGTFVPWGGFTIDDEFMACQARHHELSTPPGQCG
jgi:hypothetical protein